MEKSVEISMIFLAFTLLFSPTLSTKDYREYEYVGRIFVDTPSSQTDRGSKSHSETSRHSLKVHTVKHKSHREHHHPHLKHNQTHVNSTEYHDNLNETFANASRSGHHHQYPKHHHHRNHSHGHWNNTHHNGKNETRFHNRRHRNNTRKFQHGNSWRRNYYETNYQNGSKETSHNHTRHSHKGKTSGGILYVHINQSHQVALYEDTGIHAQRAATKKKHVEKSPPRSRKHKVNRHNSYEITEVTDRENNVRVRESSYETPLESSNEEDARRRQEKRRRKKNRNRKRNGNKRRPRKRAKQRDRHRSLSSQSEIPEFATAYDSSNSDNRRRYPLHLEHSRLRVRRSSNTTASENSQRTNRKNRKKNTRRKKKSRVRTTAPTPHSPTSVDNAYVGPHHHHSNHHGAAPIEMPHSGLAAEDVNWERLEATNYIRKIFHKYGEDEVLYFEAFEHLLESLGLGQLAIPDHDIHDHKVGPKFVQFHGTHNHTNNATAPASSPTATEDRSEHGHDHDQEEGEEDAEEGDHHHEHAGEMSEEIKESSTRQKRSRHRVRKEAKHWHDHEIFDDTCMSPQDILFLYRVNNQNKSVTVENFLYICPAILYQIEEDKCQNSRPGCALDHVDWTRHCANFHGIHHRVDDDDVDYHGDGGDDGEPHGDHSHGSDDDDDEPFKERIQSFLDIPGKVWGFAVLSVTIISLVGLLCVAVVPIMNKVLYNHLVQFLVALAVGSLTGDALLHLIPHALMSHEASDHDHSGSLESDDDDDEHREAVWKGLVVLGGAYLFFLAERLMAIISERRKRQRAAKKLPPGESLDMQPYERPPDLQIGEKLSRHKRSSLYVSAHSVGGHRRDSVADTNAEDSTELQVLQTCDEHEEDATSRAGSSSQHSHSNHGHSHGVPGSVSSIAWMVIMGDGLHNFSDGLAIGAAFSNSITVGLSTSIAVFCHELPHELGDFAVLLKAGMSVKHALFYNIVSSVLSFLGMTIGVAVGNMSSASSWIFAMTAGIFIYISLVDMLPEIALSVNSQRISRTCQQLLLQILGISTGIAIMLVIALYESKIKVG